MVLVAGSIEVYLLILVMLTHHTNTVWVASDNVKR